MHYFYVLKSGVDNGYYYGSTKNLKNRFGQHALGNVASTKHRRPLKLVYYEAYLDQEKAIKREKQVKASGSIRSKLQIRF